MENLRTGIGLHAYGQRNPLVMYQSEGQKMFVDLQKPHPARRGADAVSTWRWDPAQMARHDRQRPAAAAATPMPTAPTRAVNGSKPQRPAHRRRQSGPQTPPCPCGSGRKYKRCCGKVA